MSSAYKLTAPPYIILLCRTFLTLEGIAAKVPTAHSPNQSYHKPNRLLVSRGPGVLGVPGLAAVRGAADAVPRDPPRKAGAAGGAAHFNQRLPLRPPQPAPRPDGRPQGEQSVNNQ
eukprot:1188351-Prorocentrum_minimum.AAC.1